MAKGAQPTEDIQVIMQKLKGTEKQFLAMDSLTTNILLIIQEKHLEFYVVRKLQWLEMVMVVMMMIMKECPLQRAYLVPNTAQNGPNNA